jgi:ribosomal protein L37AE/L43A
LKKIVTSLLMILLVTIMTFLAGLGLLLYLQLNPLTNPIIERALIILVIGLIAGFSARIIIRKWHIFWRVLIPFFAVGIGISLLDKIYPHNYELVFIARTPWSEPIGIDLVQIALGYVMGLLALFIGMRRKTQQSIMRLQHASKIKTKNRSVAKQAKKLFLFRKSASDRKKNVSKKVSKQVSKKPVFTRTLPMIRTTRLVSTKSRRLQRKDVKLLGETEHRCPYCLELVKKNDSRGVVICADCKTWHHKDCWDITGSCQVAHRHDL